MVLQGFSFTDVMKDGVAQVRHSGKKQLIPVLQGSHNEIVRRQAYAASQRSEAIKTGRIKPKSSTSSVTPEIAARVRDRMLQMNEREMLFDLELAISAQHGVPGRQ